MFSNLYILDVILYFPIFYQMVILSNLLIQMVVYYLYVRSNCQMVMSYYFSKMFPGFRTTGPEGMRMQIVYSICIIIRLPLLIYLMINTSAFVQPVFESMRMQMAYPIYSIIRLTLSKSPISVNATTHRLHSNFKDGISNLSQYCESQLCFNFTDGKTRFLFFRWLSSYIPIYIKMVTCKIFQSINGKCLPIIYRVYS